MWKLPLSQEVSEYIKLVHHHMIYYNKGNSKQTFFFLVSVLFETINSIWFLLEYHTIVFSLLNQKKIELQWLITASLSFYRPMYNKPCKLFKNWERDCSSIQLLLTKCWICVGQPKAMLHLQRWSHNLIFHTRPSCVLLWGVS